jgi:hypothetical protein
VAPIDDLKSYYLPYKSLHRKRDKLEEQVFETEDAIDDLQLEIGELVAKVVPGENEDDYTILTPDEQDQLTRLAKEALRHETWGGVLLTAM